eukprot:959937-Amphidinium_carterae.1
MKSQDYNCNSTPPPKTNAIGGHRRRGCSPCHRLEPIGKGTVRNQGGINQPIQLRSEKGPLHTSGVRAVLRPALPDANSVPPRSGAETKNNNPNADKLSVSLGLYFW